MREREILRECVYCNCVIDSALALSLLNVLDVFVASAAAFRHLFHYVPLIMCPLRCETAASFTSSALYHVYFAGIKRFSGKYFTLSTHVCRVSVCGLPCVLSWQLLPPRSPAPLFPCLASCACLPDSTFKRQAQQGKSQGVLFKYACMSAYTI